MGSGNLPNRTSLSTALLGTDPITVSDFMGNTTSVGSDPLIPKGKELFSSLFDKFNKGLDPKILEALRMRTEGQLRTNQSEQEQKLNELNSSETGTPIDAIISGKTKLQNQTNRGIASNNLDLSLTNENAKNQGLSQLFQLFGIGQNESNSQSQYDLEKYKSDQQGRAGKGGALGSLIAAGGDIASTIITHGG